MPLNPEQQAEIGEARAATQSTRRATVPALEEILYEALPVLDHGFVRVVDYMGDDGAIVQAAQARTDRQGRGAVLEGEAARRVLELLRAEAERSYAGYSSLLNEDETGAPSDPNRPGLARELARINLSLSVYTQWYWKTDLHNLLHFLSLRADPHAQYEIRTYADAMLETVQRWVPLACAAFLEYRMTAATISATGLQVIRRMLAGEKVEQVGSGLSPREWRELMAVLGR